MAEETREDREDLEAEVAALEVEARNIYEAKGLNGIVESAAKQEQARKLRTRILALPAFPIQVPALATAIVPSSTVSSGDVVTHAHTHTHTHVPVVGTTVPLTGGGGTSPPTQLPNGTVAIPTTATTATTAVAATPAVTTIPVCAPPPPRSTDWNWREFRLIIGLVVALVLGLASIRCFQSLSQKGAQQIQSWPGSPLQPGPLGGVSVQSPSAPSQTLAPRKPLDPLREKIKEGIERNMEESQREAFEALP